MTDQTIQGTTQNALFIELCDSSLGLHPLESVVFSSSLDGTIRVWRLKTLEQVKQKDDIEQTSRRTDRLSGKNV